jgi:hypothetical protein
MAKRARNVECGCDSQGGDMLGRFIDTARNNVFASYIGKQNA